MTTPPANIHFDAVPPIMDPQFGEMADFIKAHMAPVTIELPIPGADRPLSFLITNPNLKVENLDKHIESHLPRPEFRRGNAQMDDLGSFIAHVNRFKDSHSAIFLHANFDQQAVTMDALLDYHEATAEGKPRWGKHRTQHKFPISSEWKAWTGMDKTQMDQGDFANFLEGRLLDIAPPPIIDKALESEDHPDYKIARMSQLLGGRFADPAKLLELSRGLSINSAEKVTQARNVSTGEVQVQYTTEHKDTDGKPIMVPNLFLIAIPVFEGDVSYRLPVSLRYRLREGNIKWFYELYRADLAFRHAVTEAGDRVKAETELPLFHGKPEQGGI
jgi:uncharacterized protein YfdQ (DUF2303 family)